MRKALISALLDLVLLPAPVSAWGFAAHRYITRRAIELLPPTSNRSSSDSLTGSSSAPSS
jgi:hypothetical protein